VRAVKIPAQLIERASDTRSRSCASQHSGKGSPGSASSERHGEGATAHSLELRKQLGQGPHTQKISTEPPLKWSKLRVPHRGRSLGPFECGPERARCVNEEKREAREGRVNFRSALRPAGMSRHNQRRSAEEGRSLLGGTHAIKGVKPSKDILEGLSTGVNC
jgi:hypothetical protein